MLNIHIQVCEAGSCWLFRAKDVDLTPYLTTRLVDDFASHIRLYRRSLAKVIEHRKDGELCMLVNTAGVSSVWDAVADVVRLLSVRWVLISSLTSLVGWGEVQTACHFLSVSDLADTGSSSLYIKRGRVSVRLLLTYVCNGGRDQLSSEWRHNENDLTMRMMS